jgi:tRNA (guanine-N7-)-methyltransferase
LNQPSASDDGAQADAEGIIRFYGRRKGKALKAGRQSLLETILPGLRIAAPVATNTLDPATLFSFAPGEVRLEIGFGSGEHLAAQAAANPGVGFIGSEVFVNGVASLARHVEEQKLANVRVFDNDVRHFLPGLKDRSLRRVSLLFPDPWPKTRHAKRRFVSPATLDELARILDDNAELRIASDHPVYVQWTLMHAPVHPAFQWLVKEPDDWRVRPADSVATRYEEKARKAGRTPVFLRFLRRPRTP